MSDPNCGVRVFLEIADLDGGYSAVDLEILAFDARLMPTSDASWSLKVDVLFEDEVDDLCTPAVLGAATEHWVHIADDRGVAEKLHLEFDAVQDDG